MVDRKGKLRTRLALAVALVTVTSFLMVYGTEAESPPVPRQPTDDTAMPTEPDATPVPTRAGRLPGTQTLQATRTLVRGLTAISPGSAGCTARHGKGDFRETVAGPAGTRSYRLHVPSSYTPGKPFPLVLNFHGYAQTASQEEAYSGLVPVADKHGFALVSPEGSGSPQGWDIVGIYDENGIDDVEFVAQLVVQLSSELCIDAKRVYATGHSNGAEMASELACYLPDTFAAVAPVSGAVFQGCAGRSVPMVAFQGTADQNVLYAWSAGAAGQWAAHNGCASPKTASISSHVKLTSWSGCTSGADIQFYAIEGGGHTWPGANPKLGGVGYTTKEINASALIWQFFQAHPMR